MGRDIHCVKCGEPWDMDCLHDMIEEQGLSYDDARVRFFQNGCEALGWGGCERPVSEGATMRAMASSAMADLLGDDVDGIAAMMEDAEAMGLW